ncbi:choice-of-anchor J domain-containing protein [Flavobacterium sp.]|uniref:T9SS-dependent choice-of-anchor J family protein n=1 Tax=Flavobacterium sp. TaxID=239 RepID=UPI002602DA73|nr:choice-of-anchor J domain-containing protein [Flavobacterium sp.]MDD2985011.1 choice-of-anchor J domain-containing protein [Flavobacterium sp.]
MKKNLLLGLMLLGINSIAFSQTVLFEDSFEAYDDFAIANVGSWTLTDVDLKSTYGFNGITFLNSGVAKSFQVFNATTTTPPIAPTATSDWTAKTGNKSMVCFAAANPAPSVNNDWLISPQITLGESGNQLSFYAKSCDATYGAEKFKVGISTTGTAPANFTVISEGAFILTDPAKVWVQYIFDLDTYANQPIYISINCISDDQFGFAVDDFQVTAMVTASAQSFFASNFAMYPNPTKNTLNLAVKNGLSINEISIIDLNGRVVKTVQSGFESEMQINVADLTSGLYLIDIKTAEGTATSKFIKN